MLKAAATGTVELGAYDKDKQVFFYEKHKVLPQDKTRKCHMACHMAWAGIANYNFVQTVPNEILVSCFQPLEVIFLCLSTKQYLMTFRSVVYNELVIFYLQNAIVLSYSTYFETLHSAYLKWTVLGNRSF